MKEILKIRLEKVMILAFSLLIVLTSCSHNAMVTTGIYSDVSLQRNSDQYSLKRLPELQSTGNAIFGIPVGKNVRNKTGIIFRFQGVSLSSIPGVFPIITMIGMTASGGYWLRERVGLDSDGSYKMPLPLTIVAAIPVAGFVNNQLWKGSSNRGVIRHMNRELLENHSDVDVFLNPRYEIDYKQGIWGQKSTVKMRVMGARIIEN